MDGVYEWATAIGSKAGYDAAHGIAASDSGGVYVTGEFEGSADADGDGLSDLISSGDGDTDAFVVQYSATDGELGRARRFGGTGTDWGRGVDVSNLGVVLVGGVFQTTAGFGDMSLTANGVADGVATTLDTSGNYKSAHQFTGPDDDRVRVAALNGAAIHAAGFFHDTVNVPTGDTLSGLGSRDAFFVKFQSAFAHDVAVTGLSAPSVIVQGDSESVDGNVENQGANDETFDVTLNSDNGTSSDSTDDFTIGSWTGVALASGSSTTLTATWDTAGVELGDHTLTAEAILGTDEDTTDNTKSATVSVEAERHDVAVTQLTAPSPVVEGDVVSVDTTVENQGNRGETFDVTLISDNGTTDTADDIAIATWSSVTLDAGDSQVLTTSWDTTDVNTADHTLTATAMTVTDETDTGDNTLAATVTVEAAPSGSTSDMYVSDIRFESRSRGKQHTDYRVVVEILHDSDATRGRFGRRGGLV